ncbi:MAG: hypothetical protein KAH95_15120 [Spirochaetales bacterium]|nr:hypothetical protein [Spirochaetales bacterium]
MDKIILTSLIEENRSQLSAGVVILEKISMEHYVFSEDSDSPWMSGVGKHFRHIIDFYDRFIDQFPLVNYDLRNRDLEIETNKEAAINRINFLSNALLIFELKEGTEKITLYQGDIPNNNNEFIVSSSLGRELRYLIEHTVHHFAIIAMFLKHYGYSVPLGFGVAKSTLDYEAKL